MSTPPGTTDEYSRKHQAFEQDLTPRRPGREHPVKAAPKAPSKPLSERGQGTPIAYSRGIGAVILACALIGAAVLVLAEFSTLYTVRAAGQSGAVQSTLAGTNNSYGLIPIAVLAVVLGLVTYRGRAGRWVPATLILVGVIALLIGLLHDLPDAHRTGLLQANHQHFVNAASSPSLGMYLETLGAVLLMVAGGLGLLFGEPVRRPRAATTTAVAAAAAQAPPRVERARPGARSGGPRSGGERARDERAPDERARDERARDAGVGERAQERAPAASPQEGPALEAAAAPDAPPQVAPVDERSNGHRAEEPPPLTPEKPGSEVAAVEPATPPEAAAVEQAPSPEPPVIEPAAPPEPPAIEPAAPPEQDAVEPAAPPERDAIEPAAPPEQDAVEGDENLRKSRKKFDILPGAQAPQGLRDAVTGADVPQRWLPREGFRGQGRRSEGSYGDCGGRQ